MKIVVVIPTYNESENIKRLIPITIEEFKKMPQHEFHVLVVDGNSPDGTGHVVEEFSKTYPFVHLLLEEKKAGLGAAYSFAFAHAIKNLQADVLVEMDADFQHDPKYILQLIEKIDAGYDYVIGSRYTKGGGIPKDWALYRKFVSIGGNIFTKLVLGIFSVNDFTSGFKASRVKGFVDKIDLDNIMSRGFAYKIDLLYKMHVLGAKIAEVPIVFGLRDRGDSKMERNNAIDSLRVVLLIRIGKNKRFFKFCVVGFAGMFVDVGTANILRLTPLGSRIAASSAVLVAMLVTFTLNNVWSFSDKKIKGFKKLAIVFVPYFISSLVPVFFRFWFVGFTISRLGDTFLWYNVALFVSIVLGLIWNFTIYNNVIWRKKN